MTQDTHEWKFLSGFELNGFVVSEESQLDVGSGDVRKHVPTFRNISGGPDQNPVPKDLQIQRDRDRDRDRDRERERGTEGVRARDREGERERGREGERQRERDTHTQR